MKAVAPSQESLRKEAAVVLSQNAALSIQEPGVELVGSRLILGGFVKTFYHKQMAQELLRRFAKAHHVRIDNRITVLEAE